MVLAVSESRYGQIVIVIVDLYSARSQSLLCAKAIGRTDENNNAASRCLQYAATRHSSKLRKNFGNLSDSTKFGIIVRNH